MHAALWKLFRMRIRGTLRSMAGKFTTLRGAALVVFTVLVLGMMLGPNTVMAFRVARTGALDRGADAFREMVPVIMLLYVVMTIVTSLGERALYFSPSEVDFLFPAPFSRRQILVYKILGNVTAAIYVALFIPISLIMFIRCWPAAAVGSFLAWLMINSLCLCVQLIAETVTEQAFGRARKLVLGGAVVAAAAALGQAVGHGFDGPWQETLLKARHSTAGEIVLAPFAVFGNVITAERLVPDALGWAAPGAMMVVGVYALAIRLDANYLETSVRVGQRFQERRRRGMSGAVFVAPSKRRVRSSWLPQPPWLGGVGPLAWRQAIQAFRGSRGAIVLAVIMVVAFGAPLASGAARQNGLPGLLPHVVVGMAAYVTFIFSAQAPLGFRGDYEYIVFLKSLPIRPLAIACGQTIVIALILTLLQWTVFAAAAVLVPTAAAEMFVAGLFILPYNWILCGTENFLFLLYPFPLAVTGSDGFLRMGRVMLVMMAKFFMVAACGVVSAIPAVIAYLVSKSLVFACLVGWLTLLLPMLGILVLTAWAFCRYDVSVEGTE